MWTCRTKNDLLLEDRVAILEVDDTKKKFSLLPEDHVKLLYASEVPNEFEIRNFGTAKPPVDHDTRVTSPY